MGNCSYENSKLDENVFIELKMGAGATREEGFQVLIITDLSDVEKNSFQKCRLMLNDETRYNCGIFK